MLIEVRFQLGLRGRRECSFNEANVGHVRYGKTTAWKPHAGGQDLALAVCVCRVVARRLHMTSVTHRQPIAISLQIDMQGCSDFVRYLCIHVNEQV